MLEINRNFGQSWYDSQVRDGLPAEVAFAQSSVGVTFYEPVDVYQRNYRAVHYAVAAHRHHVPDVLPLGAPQRQRHSRHAVPDGGPGAGAVLSTAAGVVRAPGFDIAYGISAGALVALITVYLTGVLRRLPLALGAGAGLATLYALLYWILRSEDYSLLMGALLLFGVLAILMITTRRVDWSSVGRIREAGGR